MKTNRIVLYGLYLAIFFFMALTPYIGFIKIGVISITTMLIPVIIMTWHLKWRGALVAGFYFGISSFVYAVAYGDPTIAFVGGIGNTFVAAVLTRIVLGLVLAALMIIYSRHEFSRYVKAILLAVVALAFNHMLFLGIVAIFSGSSFWWIFALIGINTTIEWPVVIISSIALVPLLTKIGDERHLGY